MRARHRHHNKLRGEAHRAHGGGVHHHPHNAISGEGTAPKLHAGKRARGGRRLVQFWAGGAVNRASGGCVEDERKSGGGKWIAGAIKHPGALHRSLGVPEGQKIPAKKLAKASHSSNPTLRRRAALAKTLKHMHH